MTDALLVSTAQGDERALARMRKRVQLGEPVAYVIGSFLFRSIQIKIDRRAYITDPELTHLVDFVIGRVRTMRQTLARPVRTVECGVGCGALSLALLAETARDEVDLLGVDLDSSTLDLARENADRLCLSLALVESDLLQDLPPGWAPDLVFGDPPWGSYQTVYDQARHSRYYQAMPPLAVYPRENPLGVHLALLAEWLKSSASELILNCGVMPAHALEALSGQSYASQILECVPGVRIFHAVK